MLPHRRVLSLILGSTLVTMLVLTAYSSASVPTAQPVFTAPLLISNTYFPFEVGAMKVFRGKDDGTRVVVVNNFEPVTRTFSWKGGKVETRQLREVEFVAGQITEISYNYFAQADDGSVYYFGEVVDIYEDGEIIAHEGSWLVGGATQPSDPLDIANALNPTIFMLANPEKGDQFKAEDLAPIVDETVTVRSLDAKVITEAGKFMNSLRVKETSAISEGAESKWYAPGIGLVKGKSLGNSKDNAFELIATSFAPITK